MHPHPDFSIPRSVRILVLGVFLLASPLAAQWTFRGLYNQTITALATDPSAPDTLWAGTKFGGIFHSTDAGATWTALGPSPIAFGSVSSLALAPDSSTLYAGTSLDFLSRSGDSSDWSTLFQGAVTSVAVDRSKDVVYVGGYGVSTSSNHGRSWASSRSLSRAIYALLADQLNPATVYAGADYEYIPGYYPGDGSPGERSGGAVFVSRDAGITWKSSPDLQHPVTAFAEDQAGTVYAATHQGLWRSTDAGKTWNALGAEGLPTTGLSSLLADPVRPGILYVGTDTGAGIFRSSDAGSHFAALRGGLPGSPVRALLADPTGRFLNAGLQSQGVWTLDLNAPLPCEADTATLCLLGGRFQVQMSAEDPSSGAAVPGDAIAGGDAFGSFSLPALTGDATLPEIAVKMVDASATPWKDYWVFYGSLTGLPYTITITDTKTGRQKTYTGSGACGGADTAGFPADAGGSGGGAPVETRVTAGPKSDSPGAVGLFDGRFRVSLSVTDPLGTGTVQGVPVALGPVSAYFSVPDVTGTSLPEVWVKFVDARAVDGHSWLFWASLTSLPYTLTLTDTVTGDSRTYASNGGEGAFCGGADTSLPGETPTPTPTPTSPPSPIDISGAWRGTFATDDSADCGPDVVDLAVSVSQNGSSFQTRLFGLPCGFSGLLAGAIGSFNPASASFNASGSVSQGGATGNAFNGSVQPSRIHLIIKDLLVPLQNQPDSLEVHPGGTLDLQR